MAYTKLKSKAAKLSPKKSKSKSIKRSVRKKSKSIKRSVRKKSKSIKRSVRKKSKSINRSLRRKSRSARRSVRRKSRSFRRSLRRKSRLVRELVRQRSRSARRSVRRRSRLARRSVRRKSRSARRSVRRRSRSARRSVRRRSRSLVRIPVTKGLLEGYQLTDLAKNRRALLMKMIRNKHATYSDIIKRLNVLVIYNKNRHPEISQKVYRDLSYIQKHVPDKYKLSPVSRSRTTIAFISPGIKLKSI